MPRSRRTYYFRVSFLPKQWKELVALAPEYDRVQAQDILKNWWRSGYLRADNRNVTLHFEALVSTEDLNQHFNDRDTIPDASLSPNTQRPKHWMLVKMEPVAMDASSRASRRLKKKLNEDWKLDRFRVDSLREFVLQTFGVQT